MLLRHGADATSGSACRENILHSAATSSDISTINVLTWPKLRGVRVDMQTLVTGLRIAFNGFSIGHENLRTT
jgi:hypothetical protein